LWRLAPIPARERQECATCSRRAVDLPAVARGHGRVLTMTLGGIRFGQGPIAQLEQNPIAGEVLKGAGLLAYELVRRSLPGAARDFPQLVFKNE
jgi:hypothetical protein